EHPWTRATPGAATVGAGFLTLVNRGGEDDRLTGARTPIAERVEIHTHRVEDGVMRMRPVEGGVALPAGGTVTFEPGGLHLMMIGLDRKLVAGESVPLTLDFAEAG